SIKQHGSILPVEVSLPKLKLISYICKMGIVDRIFKINQKEEFNRCCLEVFSYQATENPVYRQYLNLLGIQVRDIDHYLKIPFLPIEFFKTQDIICRNLEPHLTFTSSGTTGTRNSRHLVADLNWYTKSFRTAFHQFYGEVQNIAILALLPSYLERSGSSLIFMVDDLIQRSDHPESGYFLYNHTDLLASIERLKKKNVKTILFGVTYALLDFIETHQVDASELIVMETGG